MISLLVNGFKKIGIPVVIFFVYTSNLFASGSASFLNGETVNITWNASDTIPGSCVYYSAPSAYPGWPTGIALNSSSTGIDLHLIQNGDYDLGVECTGVNEGADIVRDFVSVRVYIDGLCGTSNAKSFPSKPSTGLCSAGTESSVTGSGPWSWTCSGLNGGTDSTTCNAVKGPLSPIVNATITPNLNPIPYGGSFDSMVYTSQNADYCEVYTSGSKILYSTDYNWPTTNTWGKTGPFYSDQSWTFKCYNSIGIMTEKTVYLTVCPLGEGTGCTVAAQSLPTVNISPNTPQTINLNQTIEFTSLGEDLSGDLIQHHFDIIKPSGEIVYNASNSVAFSKTGSHQAKYMLTPSDGAGEYQIRASVQDETSPWVSTDYVSITVNDNSSNPLPVVSIKPGTNRTINFGDSLVIESTSTDASSDITRHHVDVKLPTGQWIYNAANYVSFAATGNHSLVYTLDSDILSMIGMYVIKVSACDNEASGVCRWTDSTWITLNVLPFPKNGVCGSSDGASLETIDQITSRCSQGTASSITIDAPSFAWLWTCSGLDGGTASPQCGATMSRIDGESISTPLSPSFVSFPSAATPADEFLCITGTVSNLTFDSDGNFWTWTCEGSGPGAADTLGKAIVASLPSPVISLTATPVSISKGASVILSWEIQNPNGYCKLKANSSSIKTQNITESSRINKFLTRGDTRNDSFSARRIVKALRFTNTGNKAVGKTTVDNVNYPLEFELSCEADGSNAKKVRINVVNAVEG